MKKILLFVSIILACSLFLSSTLPTFAVGDNTAAEPETSYSQQDLKDDISTAKQYMVTYKEWLKQVQDGDSSQKESSGFGALGFKINQQGIDEMDNMLASAEKAVGDNQNDSAAGFLSKWYEQIQAYSKSVELQIADAYYNFVDDALIAKFFPQVDSFMESSQSSGYDLKVVSSDWKTLKEEIVQIHKSWKSDPLKSEDDMFSWYDKYDQFAEKVTAELNSQYQKSGGQ